MGLEQRSYKQILTSMQTDLMGRIGQMGLSEASDLMIKLKVLAGELERLYESRDKLFTQIFPQTATGEYLDLHCEERGLFRKNPTKATGLLTFLRAADDVIDRIIPAGTMCAASPDGAGKYLAFETIEEVVLSAGQLSVSAAAAAVDPGLAGNVAAGIVRTMISPPVGIERVANNIPFLGGSERESDEDLRLRYIRLVRNPQNVGTAGFYENIALEVEGVSAATCIPLARGNGTVDVVIRSDGGTPSAEIVIATQELLNERKLMGTDVKVIAPSRAEFNIVAQVTPKSGYSLTDIAGEIEKRIRDYFLTVGLGVPVLMSGVGDAIYNTVGVKDFKITDPKVNINLGVSQIAILKELILS